MKKLFRLISVVFILTIFLSACSGSNGNDLIGKWETEKGYTIEFFNDNTLNTNGLYGCIGSAIDGSIGTSADKEYSWVIVENGRIKLTDQWGSIATTNYKVKGDTITFTDDNGENESKLTKVKK